MAEKLMTFTEHLQELRVRLKWCVYYVLGAMILTYVFSEELYAVMALPLTRAWTEAGLGSPRLHFANPVEPFFTYLKVALIAGIFLASPGMFYQLWQFVAPGLYKKERRYVVPFTVFSAVLFLGGACFGYFMVFPYAFKFFLEFSKKNMGALKQVPGFTYELQPTLMMGEYFGLVWRLLLAFGLVFELPLVIVFLSLVGLVDYRSLWRFNRYFIIIAFVIGAVLTPPDVITQVMMSIPLVLLYELSILLSYLVTRKRVKEAERAEAADATQET